MNKKIHQYTSLFCTILVVLFIQACTPKMTININAIVDPISSNSAKNYIFISGMNDVSEDDLYFKEFTGYFEYALQQNGYKRVSDKGKADLLIRVKYAVSDGRSAFQVYQFPIYENIGGETITLTETTTGPNGQPVTTHRTIHFPARIQQVGTSNETRAYTLYNRTASLQAVLVSEAPKSSPGTQKDQSPEKIQWQIFLNSVSESADLRQVMPYFAAAAIPYIGKNSGQQRQVDIEINDPAVTALIRDINQQPKN